MIEIAKLLNCQPSGHLKFRPKALTAFYKLPRLRTSRSPCLYPKRHEHVQLYRLINYGQTKHASRNQVVFTLQEPLFASQQTHRVTYYFISIPQVTIVIITLVYIQLHNDCHRYRIMCIRFVSAPLFSGNQIKFALFLLFASRNCKFL